MYLTNLVSIFFFILMKLSVHTQSTIKEMFKWVISSHDSSLIASIWINDMSPVVFEMLFDLFKNMILFRNMRNLRWLSLLSYADNSSLILKKEYVIKLPFDYESLCRHMEQLEKVFQNLTYQITYQFCLPQSTIYDSRHLLYTKTYKYCWKTPWSNLYKWMSMLI